MPNAAGFDFGVACLIAGFLFLGLMFIFFRRYRRIRLRITFLRGLIPMLFALICFSNAFAIFEDRPDYALSWYRLIAISIVATEGINLIFLTYVIYGRFHGTTGTLNMILAGVNLFLVFTEENFKVVQSPEYLAFYPVLSVVFLATNIVQGLFHTGYDVRANLKVLRRSDMSASTRFKFFLFTSGIAIMYVTFASAMLAIIVFQTGAYYFWSVLGYYGGLVLIFLGLFYANPSVFYLPIRLYLLVVFRGGGQGEILYERHFTPIQSTSAQLLGPAVASIADLVQKAFQQSKHLRLFSLPRRKLLYEWDSNIGAVLLADRETTVFRNCLQLVLKETSLLPAEKSKFDARVGEIFSFYMNERRE